MSEHKPLNEYKPLLISFLGVLLGFSLASLEYYKIAKVASLGAWISGMLIIYGFIGQVRIVNKKLFKSNDESNCTKEND